MLCENCGERRADIHLVKIINGVRTEEDICRKCAEKMMPFHEAAKALKKSFSLEDIMNAENALKNLLLPILPELYGIGDKEMKCPHCGKEIDPDELFCQLGDNRENRDIVFDFSQAAARADSAGDAHEARSEVQVHVPVVGAPITKEPVSSEKELAGLKRELDLVLRGERYERAAEIRDRIIELEKTINESKGA